MKIIVKKRLSCVKYRGFLKKLFTLISNINILDAEIGRYEKSTHSNLLLFPIAVYLLLSAWGFLFSK